MKNKLNILIAEDEFFVRSEIRRIVTVAGHNVVGEASNGEIAIAKTEELKPDIILMDIGMQVMGGIEAAGIIQEKCPTPIVFLTAYEDDESLRMASAAGAGAYLTKPPNAAAVERAIVVALARHEDLVQLRQLNEQMEVKNRELEQALAEIKTLRDILPICCFCKKIRDDEGYWNKIELYIQQHTDSKFSHGICPDCAEEHYSIKLPDKD